MPEQLTRNFVHKQDISGMSFGGWTVLHATTEKRKRRGTYWLCRCVCGKERLVCGAALIRGKTKSCGCLAAKAASERAKKHGHSHLREWRRWKAIIYRCENPNSTSYERYGGRGITVCERWRGEDGFLNFTTDMGPPPAEGFSVERIDNNGSYCPENCRWASSMEQANNSRRSVILEYMGERKTVSEWARVIGIGVGTLSQRIRDGWSVEDALEIRPHDFLQLRTEIRRLQAKLVEHGIDPNG